MIKNIVDVYLNVKSANGKEINCLYNFVSHFIKELKENKTFGNTYRRYLHKNNKIGRYRNKNRP